MPTDLEKARGIFIYAVGNLPTEQWESYVAEACGGDVELRQHVGSLLRVHRDAEAGRFLETPAPGLQAALGPPIAEKPGSMIGPYKLLEQIGEGGMGVVYMAEQQEPVRRKVALKIIKLGMDTKQVIGRFEAERQALALMDHPNIAKILDAGATESGRPYFVMDYVRGIPITEYCDQNNLTTKERLGIFIDVCSAVQHAHQKGIIHRDLKPGNVLVTHHDGQPMPKIIDFGIAKATEQRLTEKTHFTEHRQLVGTPEYMSPEQATFCDADVDTRSDIYSLGVLLYELLVGTTPFDARELCSRGYEEICRVIREGDAPTPSKRLSSLGEAASEISKHRHVEPAALRKLLRGDLDWIAMKALEKDRSRRYETVHALAQDIERHLSDEPVRARPPSTGYRLRKWVRKHRVAAAATIAVLTALVAGLALMSLGFARAKQAERVANAQRDQAQQNLQLARQLMSDLVGPATDRVFDFPFAQDYLREMLGHARVFHERLLQQAADDRDLRHEMARIHRRLAWQDWFTGQDAEPALRHSLSILSNLAEQFPGDPSLREDVGRAHAFLSDWCAWDLRFEEAVKQRRIALGIIRDLVAEFPSNEEYHGALTFRNHVMGWCLAGIGNFDEAEKYYLAAMTSDGPLEPKQRVQIRVYYAHFLLGVARYQEADQLLEEALQIAERELPPNASPPVPGWWHTNFHLASCYNMVGLWNLHMGRFAVAEQHLRRAIDRMAPLLDDYSPLVWLPHHCGTWQTDLADVLMAMERIEEAEDTLRQFLTAWDSANTPVVARVPYSKSLAHYRLGELLHHSDHSEEARRQFVQAQAIMEELTMRRPDESICHWQLILLLANCPDVELRDPARAVSLAQHVLPKQAGHYWRYLALAQYRSDKWQDAADSIQQAMDLRQGGDAFDWLLLAITHWQLGRKEEAIQWYTKAHNAIETGKPLFYEYLGVMAVERLRNEAATLLSVQTKDTNEE